MENTDAEKNTIENSDAGVENENQELPIENDNIEEITLDQKTPITKQKWFIPAIVGIVIFLLLSSAVWAFFSQPNEEENDNNQELVETSPTPTPTPTKSLTRPSVTEVTPTPKITPSVSPTPSEQVTFTGPTIKENNDDTVYTYTLNLNSAAASKYSGGINYTINAVNCNIEEMFKTNTDFSGTFNNVKSGNNTIAISIYEVYLNSKTNLKDSTYTLKDSKGNTIKTGEVEIPDCKAADEENDNGEFSVELDEVNENLVAGKVHYEWSFEFDNDAQDLLEEGFTHKLKHDCDEWVESEDRDYFESTWNAGEIGNIGYATNIDEEGIDLDDATETSTYEIFDKDGDKIFSGFYEAPKCK